MASPLKRIKLTPLNRSGISQRLTQETKCSTPRPTLGNELGNVFSPNFSCSSDLSAIMSSSEEANSVAGRRGHNSSQRSSTPRSLNYSVDADDLSNEYDGENYENYFQQQRRGVARKGQIWKYYKPITDNTLYAKVLNGPGNVQITVSELLFCYKTEPDVALKELIKFCVDVAGLQHFNAALHYDVTNVEESSKRLRRMFESDEVIDKHPLLKNSGRYLLMERNTSLAKHLRMGLYYFLQNLILSAHDNGILYDEMFNTNFFAFIKIMVQSNVKCVRHAGVIIAVKVLTAIVLIYNKVINDSNCEENLGISRTRTSELNEQMAKLITFIECLYIIFMKNCRLQDNTVYMMRVECIYDTKIWIKYFPKLFIGDFQTVDLVIKLITDASKEVRLAALGACEDLFGIPRVLEFLKPIKNNLTKAVSERFYDVNIDVAVKALDIFTNLLQIDRDFISEEVFMKIEHLIFDKYAPIGKASSKIVVAYLDRRFKTSGNKLIAVASMLSVSRELHCAKELLVESFLYSCPEMQDWPVFCKLIMSDDVPDIKVKEYLAEIFSEAVRQRLKGQSSINRNLSISVIDVGTLPHLKVAEVLATLNKILSEQSNPKITAEILRIIPLVNISLLEKNFCKVYSEISETIRVLFNHHFDEDVLRTAVAALVHLCDIAEFAKRGKILAKIVCKENADELMRFLNQPTDGGYQFAKKVAILYEHFDLNDQLSFQDLSGFSEEADEMTVSHILVCCKWYLMWRLRKLSENAGGRQRENFYQITHELLNACKVFTIRCFDKLASLEPNEKLVLEVYSTLCDFYNLFVKELEAPIKVNMNFKDLQLKIKDEQMQIFLAKVLKKYVICSNTMPLQERRMNVVRYIDLIHRGILLPESLVNVFKYYHQFNTEYGPIIEYSLTSISNFEDNNIIYFIVVYTLRSVYEEILDIFGVMDIRSEKGVELKLLSKQFAAFKYFHGRNQAFKLLMMLIKDAFREEKHLTFLYVAKYFVELVHNEEDKKKIQNTFQLKVKKEFEKNDVVLYFASALKIVPSKNKGRSKIKTPQMPKSVSKENRKPKKDSRQKKDSNTKGASNTRKTKAVTPSSSKSKSKNISSQSTDDIEMELSEMTIHDTESDDLDETFTSLPNL